LRQRAVDGVPRGRAVKGGNEYDGEVLRSEQDCWTRVRGDRKDKDADEEGGKFARYSKCRRSGVPVVDVDELHKFAHTTVRAHL